MPKYWERTDQTKAGFPPQLPHPRLSAPSCAPCCHVQAHLGSSCRHAPVSLSWPVGPIAGGECRPAPSSCLHFLATGWLEKSSQKAVFSLLFFSWRRANRSEDRAGGKSFPEVHYVGGGSSLWTKVKRWSGQRKVSSLDAFLPPVMAWYWLLCLHNAFTYSS